MPRRAQETKFLQLLFQGHYRANPENVDIPSKVHAREFGMESWAYTWRCFERIERDESGSTIRKGCGRSGNSFVRVSKCPNCGSSDIQVNNWTRHHGFRTADALAKELATLAPHSVYHSAAFYKIPVARHMDEKEWQGAELVFDIDADHLNSPCADEHDSWRCNNPECGETGSGQSPKAGCPKCKGMSFSSRKWICDRCLDDAKKTLLKVVPVTHDIHRVIRLIGSLNGKTGFLVSELTRDETDDFDPFGDALAFDEGALKLRVAGGQVKVPRFRIGDDAYGPYGDEVVELPMSAAVFLLCKGVATIE